MNHQETEIFIRLQQSLLYNIPQRLKKLSYTFSGNRISILAVFTDEPREFEIDCMYSAVGEFNGYYINEFNVDVEFAVEKKPLLLLKLRIELFYYLQGMKQKNTEEQ